MTMLEKFLRAISGRFTKQGVIVDEFSFKPNGNADGNIEINYKLVCNKTVYNRKVFFPRNFDGELADLADYIKNQIDDICRELKEVAYTEQIHFKDLG